MTNIERIKNLSVEELAELINKIAFCCNYEECENCPIDKFRGYDGCHESTVEKWLESEYEEELSNA